MKKPTKTEVLTTLAGEISMYRRSYKEADGKVRDKGALWTIACLREAKQIVSKRRIPSCHLLHRL
jgi:hypothetical protein